MSETTQELWGAVAFGAIAYVVLWMGWKKGFFRYPSVDSWKVPLTIFHVLTTFAIYFGVILLITPLIVSLLRRSPGPMNLAALATWMNVLTSSLIALLLIVFWKTRSPLISHEIWRQETRAPHYLDDVKMAALSWLISFPLVISISQFLDVIVFKLFHVTQLPDQAAVNFLKMTFDQPFYLFLATLSIVVLAPFIEELIFRGFLQTYARKFVSPTSAILISSTCFSFFHYTPEQGLGNIPIIGSLFILALFLGFIYERQRSLLASISLHAMFNIISVINLYCLGGAPRGAL